MGVVLRRYIDFLILLIRTPLVSVLFCSSIPTTFFILLKLYILYCNYCRYRQKHIIQKCGVCVERDQLAFVMELGSLFHYLHEVNETLR